MRKTLFIILLTFSVGSLKAQTSLDSLNVIWEDETQTDSARVKAYHYSIYNNFLFSNPDNAFLMAEELLIYAHKNNYPKAQALAFNALGAAWEIKGDYSKSLDFHTQSLKVYDQIGDKGGVGSCLVNIGYLYEEQGDYLKAMDYYTQGLMIFKQKDEKRRMAVALINIGNIYMEQGDYPKAMDYCTQGLEIFRQGSVTHYDAESLNMIGSIYQKQGDDTKALDYYTQCLEICKQISDSHEKVNSLNSIGRIYKDQGNYTKALDYCKKGYKLALSMGILESQKEGCTCLYETYKALGIDNKALFYIESLQELDNSLHKEEITKKLQQMEFQKQVYRDSVATAEKERLIEEAHNEEIQQEEKTRNIGFGIGVFFLLLATGFYVSWRYVKRSKTILQVEKDRSENLLLNILPEEIAQELKEKGEAKAREFDMVSILFTDFKSFTAASEKLSAQELVAEINTCFEAFDGIMGKYNIEKIKTIGDAYMAAGGLPVPADDSVKNTILAALEMQVFISKRKVEMDAKGLPAFEMRVGIHTGSVIAGIVGVKKFQYDIWGDTVNTASRMESSGEVAKVNISQDTYELLKSEPLFAFESRGKIKAKGKGEMEMYFTKLK